MFKVQVGKAKAVGGPDRYAIVVDPQGVPLALCGNFDGVDLLGLIRMVCGPENVASFSKTTTNVEPAYADIATQFLACKKLPSLAFFVSCSAIGPNQGMDDPISVSTRARITHVFQLQGDMNGGYGPAYTLIIKKKGTEFAGLSIDETDFVMGSLGYIYSVSHNGVPRTDVNTIKPIKATDAHAYSRASIQRFDAWMQDGCPGLALPAPVYHAPPALPPPPPLPAFGLPPGGQQQPQAFRLQAPPAQVPELEAPPAVLQIEAQPVNPMAYLSTIATEFATSCASHATTVPNTFDCVTQGLAHLFLFNAKHFTDTADHDQEFAELCANTFAERVPTPPFERNSVYDAVLAFLVHHVHNIRMACRQLVLNGTPYDVPDFPEPIEWLGDTAIAPYTDGGAPMDTMILAVQVPPMPSLHDLCGPDLFTKKGGKLVPFEPAREAERPHDLRFEVPGGLYLHFLKSFHRNRKPTREEAQTLAKVIASIIDNTLKPDKANEDEAGAQAEAGPASGDDAGTS
eukprot:c18447_g1_i2.p1 GENE.c18447_g1_i2~~c18447_g1_i2.p1  ORF type:complete len:514 (-),score=74.16 c18447_g1_i2:80-1621(-)